MTARKQSPDAPPPSENGIYPKWSKRDRVWKFDVVAQVDGKQRWSRGHATAPLARAARDQMRVDMRRGLLGNAPARLTVGDLVTKHWLPAKEAELHVGNSVLQCRWAASKITSALGTIRLSRLSSLDVEVWKRDLVRSGLAPTSCYLIFSRLHEVIGWAVRHDMIYRNVCDQVDAPRKGSYSPPAITMELVHLLLNVSDAVSKSTDNITRTITSFGLMVWLTAMTGLRWGELASLTWSAIDVASSELHTASKSAAGRRTIALGPRTLERLLEHRAEQMRTFFEQDAPPPANVFLDEDGNPWTRNRRNAIWYVVRSRAGVPAMHWHDLRHVHATLLARAGVHPNVMQARLGHADPAMSLYYTHGMPGEQVVGAAAVEEMLT